MQHTYDLVGGYIGFYRLSGDKCEVIPDSMPFNKWHREDSSNIKPIPQTNTGTYLKRRDIMIKQTIEGQHTTKYIFTNGSEVSFKREFSGQYLG